MLTEEQMKTMAAAFVREQLHQFEGSRAEGVLADAEIEWNQLPVETLDQMVDAFQKDLAGRNSERKQTRNLVDMFVAENGLPIRIGTPEYNRLVWHFTHALLHFTIIERDRRGGKYDNEFDTMMPFILGAATTPEGVAAITKTIRDVIAEFFKEKEAGNRWDAKTRQQSESSLNLMLELLPDKPISNITHHDMMDMRDTLRRLPANRSKSPEFKGKPLDKILEMPHIKPMSVTTVNNILIRIAAFWNWAEEHEYIAKSPAKHLILPTSKRADEEREIYTTSELQSLVNAVAAETNPSKHPERIWLTLVAMHSGMRPNEIAQLYLDDVVEEDGVLCLRVNDIQKDQKVKNKSARRSVPVHPLLLDFGFREYVDSVRKSNPTGRLFPKLADHRDGYYASFGKWFQKMNRQFVTTKSDKVFYSLRHNFATALKGLRVETNILSEILGHAAQGETMGRYGKRYTQSLLFDTVKQLNYGLDMTAIRNAARYTYESSQSKPA